MEVLEFLWDSNPCCENGWSRAKCAATILMFIFSTEARGEKYLVIFWRLLCANKGSCRWYIISHTRYHQGKTGKKEENWVAQIPCYDCSVASPSPSASLMLDFKKLESCRFPGTTRGHDEYLQHSHPSRVWCGKRWERTRGMRINSQITLSCNRSRILWWTCPNLWGRICWGRIGQTGGTRDSLMDNQQWAMPK